MNTPQAQLAQPSEPFSERDADNLELIMSIILLAKVHQIQCADELIAFACMHNPEQPVARIKECIFLISREIPKEDV